MLYKIIGDSCMDLTEELKLDPHFQMIPLTLQIGDYKVTDDETFNQKEFLAKVKASPECPKTACPSPESFKEAFEGEAEYIFVVTLSNHLSGCYNSAALAKRLYEEENGTDGKKIAALIFHLAPYRQSPHQSGTLLIPFPSQVSSFRAVSHAPFA